MYSLRSPCSDCKGFVVLKGETMYNKKSQEQAVADLIKVHGDKYDYSETIYTRAVDSVEIKCKLHGKFSIIYDAHRSGKGCKKCGEISRRSARLKPYSEFLERARKVHGSKYSYIKESYSNLSSKMEIVCRKHGVFLQLPEKHLSGHGCKYCSNKGPVTYDNFLSRSAEKHDYKYDYSLVDASLFDRNIETFKVEIICPVHGNYTQTARNHIQGQGCRKCMKCGFNISKPGSLYILVSKCSRYIKIGITNRDIYIRVKEINKKSPYDFQLEYSRTFADGEQLLNFETTILNYLSAQMITTKHVFSGSTECFELSGYSPQMIVTAVRGFL